MKDKLRSREELVGEQSVPRSEMAMLENPDSERKEMERPLDE